jgi:hypothetical protein
VWVVREDVFDDVSGGVFSYFDTERARHLDSLLGIRLRIGYDEKRDLNCEW